MNEWTKEEREHRERIKEELEREIEELTSRMKDIEEEVRKIYIRLRELGGLKLAAENNRNESEIERLKEKIRKTEEEKRGREEALNGHNNKKEEFKDTTWRNRKRLRRLNTQRQSILQRNLYNP